MKQYKNKLDLLMGIWYEKTPTIEPKDKEGMIPKSLDRFINPYGENPKEFRDRYDL